MWKAHLLLKKVRLLEDKGALVVASALGRYTVDALRQATTSTFPTVAAMRCKSCRGATPRRGHIMAQRGRGQGKDRGRGRGRAAPGRRAFRVNEADIDDDDGATLTFRPRTTGDSTPSHPFPLGTMMTMMATLNFRVTSRRS